MKKKVCILTSVHPVFDVRIFYKQIRTLKEAGYDIILIAQNDKDETMNGIRIIGLSKPRNRFFRIFKTTWKIFFIAKKQNVGIYHFHDPELLLAAMFLKIFTRRKIVYDIHEEIYSGILTKEWLPFFLRKLIAVFYKILEKIAIHFIDQIILAEDSYLKYYKNKNAIVIRNYPFICYAKNLKNIKNLDPTIIYSGAISENRGAIEMIEAINILKEKHFYISLNLVGHIQKNFYRKLDNLINYYGLQKNVFINNPVNHPNVYKLINQSWIGLSLLHPDPNFKESLSTKLFEYMTVGIPSIVSDFPLLKDIVEENNCGITVNPKNIEEIIQAINFLIEHPKEAQKMGENGKKAVLDKYNWESESKKLLEIYKKLCVE